MLGYPQPRTRTGLRPHGQPARVICAAHPRRTLNPERLEANKQALLSKVDAPALRWPPRGMEQKRLCELSPALVAQRAGELAALFPAHGALVGEALARAPGTLLACTPERVAHKVAALGGALGVGEAEALRLVAREAGLLSRSGEGLAGRVAALKALIGEQRAVEAVLRAPALLDQSTELLAWKARAIARAAPGCAKWGEELAGRMSGGKYGGMLAASAKSYMRLRYLQDMGQLSPKVASMGHVLSYTTAEWAKRAPDFEEWLSRLPPGELPHKGGGRAAAAAAAAAGAAAAGAAGGADSG